jgi:uncharacterized peroxidase-related enzyme
VFVSVYDPVNSLAHHSQFSFILNSNSLKWVSQCLINKADPPVPIGLGYWRTALKQSKMPHIPLDDHLPGITGLLEYRKDSAEPIRELTQFLLRGPSTLSEAERELIATIVSHGNECKFCTTAHTAAADKLLGECYTTEAIKNDIESSLVSDKIKVLLIIAKQVQQSGKAVTEESVKRAKNAGATDIEIHDTVLIAALFCMYNRYVDGLATRLPDTSQYYNTLAERLVTNGYKRLPQGYDHLKKH